MAACNKQAKARQNVAGVGAGGSRVAGGNTSDLIVEGPGVRVGPVRVEAALEQADRITYG